jgi:hypothetical protein
MRVRLCQFLEKTGQVEYISDIHKGIFTKYNYDRNGNLLIKRNVGANSRKDMWKSLLNASGNFENNNGSTGLADKWSITGGPSVTLDSDSRFGYKSQRMQIANTYGALLQNIGAVSSGRSFIVLVDYKMTTSNPVSLRVNDSGQDWGINLGVQYFTQSNTWKTAYVKFKSTGNPITLIPAYLDYGTQDVKIDGVRIYEVSTTIFDKIDVDPEYSGEKLTERYGYGDLLDGSGGFAIDSNQDGLTDGWSFTGNVTTRMDNDSLHNTSSQQLTGTNGWGTIYKNVGALTPGKYYLALVDYKSGSTGSVSMRVNDGGTDWGLNLGYYYFQQDNSWHTAYIKFPSTGKPIQIIAAYMDSGYQNVKLDSLRLYEVSPTIYNQIDKDQEYSGSKLISKFPYDELAEY